MSYSGSSEEEEGQTPVVTQTCNSSPFYTYLILAIITFIIFVISGFLFSSDYIKNPLIEKILMGITIISAILCIVFLAMIPSKWKSKCH